MSSIDTNTNLINTYNLFFLFCLWDYYHHHHRSRRRGRRCRRRRCRRCLSRKDFIVSNAHIFSFLNVFVVLTFCVASFSYLSSSCHTHQPTTFYLDTYTTAFVLSVLLLMGFYWSIFHYFYIIMHVCRFFLLLLLFCISLSHYSLLLQRSTNKDQVFKTLAHTEGP